MVQHVRAGIDTYVFCAFIKQRDAHRLRVFYEARRSSYRTAMPGLPRGGLRAIAGYRSGAFSPMQPRSYSGLGHAMSGTAFSHSARRVGVSLQR